MKFFKCHTEGWHCINDKKSTKEINDLVSSLIRNIKTTTIWKQFLYKKWILYTKYFSTFVIFIDFCYLFCIRKFEYTVSNQ